MSSRAEQVVVDGWVTRKPRALARRHAARRLRRAGVRVVQGARA